MSFLDSINLVFTEIMKLNISEYDKARIIASLETSLLVDKKDILLDNLRIDNKRETFKEYDYIKDPSNVKMILLSLKNTSQMIDIESKYKSGHEPNFFDFDDFYKPFSSKFSLSDDFEMFLSACYFGVSDEEKINDFKKYYKKEYNNNKAIIALSLNSDDKKIEILKDIKSKLDRAKVVASLSSNDIKFEELENQKKEYNKALIIASLQIPDDEKLELMKRKNIYHKENKMLIIKELLSDSKKIRLMEENLGEYNIAQIIGSLSLSDEEKMILFEHYNNSVYDSSCVDLLVTLESNNKKLDLINKMRDYEKELEKENEISNESKIGFFIDDGSNSITEFNSIRQKILDKSDGIGFSSNDNSQTIEKIDPHIIKGIDSQQAKLDEKTKREKTINEIKEKSKKLKSLRERNANLEKQKNKDNRTGWIIIE